MLSEHHRGKEKLEIQRKKEEKKNRSEQPMPSENYNGKLKLEIQRKTIKIKILKVTYLKNNKLYKYI